MHPSRLIVMLTVLLGFAPESSAADQQCLHDPAVNRAKVGLVLGGGGARGEAHIGVLRVLEELRIPIDYVAGTSMGSIVGGFYAIGMDSIELERVVREIHWQEVFADDTRRQDRPFRRKRDDQLALFGPKLGLGKEASLLPKGAISGQKIGFLLETIVNQRVQVRDFDQLPIPFRAIATDIVTGREVRLGSGAVSSAMQASMSVPAVFAPTELNGQLLVDGGIVNNLPINVVQQMGAEVVIAVDVGSGLMPKEALNNVLAITSQLTNLMTYNNTREQIKQMDEEDILIVPELGTELESMDFEKIDLAIELGSQAARRHLEQLGRYSLSAEEYDRHRRLIRACITDLPIIDWVRIDNRSPLRDDVIEEQLHIRPGQPLDRARLKRDIEQIYALGFMRAVPYQIVEENGQTGVLVTVLPDERGSNLIEYGFDLIGDGDSSEINLRAGYLKTDIDGLGSEFRSLVQLGEDYGLLAELYKPLDRDLRFIVLPRISAERYDLGQFDVKGNQSSTTEIEQYSLSLRIGREFGRHAAVLVGARRFAGDSRTRIGSPIETFEFDGGEYLLEMQYDRLDNRYFPSSGTLFSLQYLVSSDTLGADADYEQLLLSFAKPWTWGRHTLIGGFQFNTSMDDTAPEYAQFRGGGFLRLSGLRDNELSGPNFGTASAMYRYEVGRTGFLPAYAGTTVEYGNVAEKSGDVFSDGLFAGSLFFGYDSPIGPLYVGYGVTENGRSNFFLRIGNVFSRSTIGR